MASKRALRTMVAGQIRSTARSRRYVSFVSFVFVIECILGPLLNFVLAGVIYRRFWKDVADPYKCGALLNQGEWLDAIPDSANPIPFQNWQPPGCMIHIYNRGDIEDCFRNRRMVLIGDSTIRQIYWAIAAKMGQQSINEQDSAITEVGKHQNFEVMSAGAAIQFIWDPWLNSTALERELRRFKPDSDPLSGSEVDDSAGVMLVGAPGLWFARYGSENFFKEYREAVDNVIQYMDHVPHDPALTTERKSFRGRQGSPNLLLMAPVQVPDYKSLSPEREETITPEKIDRMNDYLQQASAHSDADLLWSYSLMTWEVNNSCNDSGIHVVESIAHWKADILLNLRCNAAHRVLPHDRTCCMDYAPPSGAQWLIIVSGVLPSLATLCMLVKRSYYPAREISSTVLWFSVVLIFCFFADRTPFFEKTQKQFRTIQFIIPCILLANLGFLSIRKITITTDQGTDSGFLSRHQTDEWKGWMQALILVYHYTGGSKSLPIYQVVRILVASYLFMTGYGHTFCFLQSKDYSLRRVAAVLIRLNLFPIALSYMMRTNYLFYYFPALVSFWFLVLQIVLRICRKQNSNPSFVLLKIVLSSMLTTALTSTPALLEFIAFLLKITCRISWNVAEWRFRLALDQYIVYVGMITALFHHRSCHLPKNRAQMGLFDKLCQFMTDSGQTAYKFATLLAMSLLLFAYWTVARKYLDKTSYNQWQPYFSWIPVLSFVVFRNSHRNLRNYHSAAFAWLGRTSLETYILQYHIWLAGDSVGLLQLGLFSSGMETTILTVLFLQLSRRTTRTTHQLTSLIVGADDVTGHPSLKDANLASRGRMNLYTCRRNSQGDLRFSKEISSGSNFASSSGGLGKFVKMLKEDLKWRLVMIGVFLWLANILFE